MYFDPIACGIRIRDLRKSRNLTQEEFASRLNVSVDHLGRLELGKRGCSIDLLIEVAIYFDISLDYLILGKEYSSQRVKQAIRKMKEELALLEETI